MKPRTQISDLEDWMGEYGASGIVHDMTLIAVSKGETSRPWLKAAVALVQCLVQLERIKHDTIGSKEADRENI
jgi:hypothetical protein